MSDKAITRAEFEVKFPTPERVYWSDEYCIYMGFPPYSIPHNDRFVGWQAAKEQYAPREAELIKLLKVAECPANCTDGAYADNYGEPVQCQFCYEREQLIATKEPQ